MMAIGKFLRKNINGSKTIVIIFMFIFFYPPLSFAASAVSLSSGNYSYFAFDKIANYRYTVNLDVLGGDCDLYGHHTGSPSTGNYQYKSVNGSSSDESFSFDSSIDGRYHLAVYAYSNCIFNPPTFTKTLIAIPADLSVVSLNAASGTYNAGDSILVNNLVRNIGGQAATGYSVSFYASLNTNITTSDYFLGTSTRGSLNADTTHNYNTTMYFPANIPAGNYYIGLILTYPDANASNNKGYDSTKVSITVPVADLSVASINATNGNYDPGDIISINNAVKNIGGQSSGSYSVTLYASANTIISTSDFPLGTYSRSSLNSDRIATHDTSLILPKAIPAGDYYIGMIVDYSDSNAVNNIGYDPTTITINSLADLVARNLTISQSDGTVFNGDTITVNFNVLNQGGYSPSSHQGIMLSTNTIITSTDTLLGSEYTGLLLAGSDTNEAISVTIPANISGRYYLGILIDKDSEVIEGGGENNNNTAYIAIDIPDWPKSLHVNSEGCYVGGLLESVDMVIAGTGSVAEKQAAKKQLDYWNEYISIFTNITIVTGSGSSGNGVNEVNVLIDSATTETNYGFVMEPNLLGRAVMSPGDAFDKTINGCQDYTAGSGDTFSEIDVVINDDFQSQWYIDPDESYSDSLIQATVLHELGHNLGLHHVFTLTAGDTYSVMNYGDHFSRRFVTRMDANTIRMHYPSKVENLTDIGIFPFTYGNDKYATVKATISSTNVKPGEQLILSNMLMQNIGNQVVENLLITYYFSTNKNITNSDYVLGTASAASVSINNEQDLLSFSFTVPTDVPAGSYYVGAIVTVDGSEDSVTVNNRFVMGTGPLYQKITIDKPEVATSSATLVSQNEATLNALVNPSGLDTSLTFDYGYSTNYGLSASYGNVGSGNSTLSLAKPIEGLTCGSVYHYRAKITSSAGFDYGNNVSFSTSACPAPSVITNVVSNLTSTRATFNATVNPNGVSTTLDFQYGESTNYGFIAIYGGVGDGTVLKLGSQTVEALKCGNSYFYRARASSDNGISYGANLLFTTAECPVNAVDSDNDGMTDAYEITNGLNPNINDSSLDADLDGLTNLEEYNLGTNPQLADTDGDAIPDGFEVSHNMDPTTNDSSLDEDSDSISNLDEYLAAIALRYTVIKLKNGKVLVLP